MRVALAIQSRDATRYDSAPLTFRDDGDAARMRADALAKELAEIERALDDERRARIDAEKKLAEARDALAKRRDVAPDSPATKPSKTSPSARSTKRPRPRWHMMLAGAGISAATLVVLTLSLVAIGPKGLDLPTRPTPERRVPGCSCKLTDGREVTLGLRVASASRMQNAPGRPWQWYLQWIAHYGRDRLVLGGSAPSGGIWGDPDVRAYIACVGNDRLVAASHSNVSAYSLTEHRLLWNRDTMNHLGTGMRGATCDTLPDVHDGVVRIPGSEGATVRLRLRDGHDAD